MMTPQDSIDTRIPGIALIVSMAVWFLAVGTLMILRKV